MEGDEVGSGLKCCSERKGSACRQIHPMPQFVQVFSLYWSSQSVKLKSQLVLIKHLSIWKLDEKWFPVQVSLEAVSEGLLSRRYLKKVEEKGNEEETIVEVNFETNCFLVGRNWNYYWGWAKGSHCVWNCHFSPLRGSQNYHCGALGCLFKYTESIWRLLNAF